MSSMITMFECTFCTCLYVFNLRKQLYISEDVVVVRYLLCERENKCVSVSILASFNNSSILIDVDIVCRCATHYSE